MTQSIEEQPLLNLERHNEIAMACRPSSQSAEKKRVHAEEVRSEVRERVNELNTLTEKRALTGNSPKTNHDAKIQRLLLIA